ncbi:MAG: hypothetical protein Q9207_008206 [Kuettlingeria erythrocarpa]
MLTILLVLLAKFDQRPLSRWHSRLSLNTIIAVLSQLAQACLLLPIARSISQLQWLWYRKQSPLADMSYFDEGSRGLIDSLLLLFKQYTSLLVWLGVVPMLLQAFIGPFAQQALSLPERQIKHGDAMIPRVLRVDTFDLSNYEDVKVEDAFYPDVSLPMKLAISTGLSRDGVTHSEVQGRSSTGNATFDIFTSMGVCASAEDVTSTIVSNCQEFKNGSTVSDDKCTATVQGLLDSPPPFQSFPSHIPENDGDTLWIGSSMYSPGKANPYQSSSNILAEFYVIYLPDINVVSVHRGEPKGNAHGIAVVPYAKNKLQALKGTLSLCSYTFNSSIEFGVTKTSVLNRDTKLDWDNGAYKLTDADGRFGIVAKTSDRSEILYMDTRTMTGLNVLLAHSTFTGTAQMSPPTEQAQAHGLVWDSDIVWTSGTEVFSTEASKAIARHLYDGDSGTKVTDGAKALSNLLDNLATSMTNGLGPQASRF